MRGRKPVPTALKVLRGNPGRRPLNDREPAHADLELAAPAELEDPLARVEWDRVIATLAKGHCTVVDQKTLVIYCATFARWVRLEAEARSHPSIVRAPSGYPIPNPLIGMANRAAALTLKAAAELGITPSSRARIVISGEAERGPVDAFTSFQRRRKGA